MNGDWIKFVNQGVFNFMKTPFLVVIALLIVIVAVTAFFVIREIKNGTR